mgnify:CR=1 FL=1
MLKITETSFVQNIYNADLKIDKKLFKKIKNYSVKRYKDLNTTYYETLPKGLTKEITDYLDLYITEVGKLLGKKSYAFNGMWIQKYGIADYHNLHLHDDKKTSYSFVLYIDGGPKSGSTKFYSLGYPYLNYCHSIESQPLPGKCVIFFSSLPHESKPSRDNKKLIVSGNIEYS